MHFLKTGASNCAHSVFRKQTQKAKTVQPAHHGCLAMTRFANKMIMRAECHTFKALTLKGQLTETLSFHPHPLTPSTQATLATLLIREAVLRFRPLDACSSHQVQRIKKKKTLKKKATRLHAARVVSYVWPCLRPKQLLQPPTHERRSRGRPWERQHSCLCLHVVRSFCM